MPIAPGTFVGELYSENNVIFEWDGEKWSGYTRNFPFYTNVGDIKIWTTSNVPLGFLLCDGSSVSRTTYANLFSVIGTSYGSVDANTFNLPDFRDRMPVGAGNLYGTNATGGYRDKVNIDHSHTWGASSSIESNDHTHSISTDGDHNHVPSLGGYFMVETFTTYPPDDAYLDGSDNSWYSEALAGQLTNNGSHTHTLGNNDTNHTHAFSGYVDSYGVSGAEFNIPPYLSMYFIIKY
jgi:microcystin-dependent protein